MALRGVNSAPVNAGKQPSTGTDSQSFNAALEAEQTATTPVLPPANSQNSQQSDRQGQQTPLDNGNTEEMLLAQAGAPPSTSWTGRPPQRQEDINASFFDSETGQTVRVVQPLWKDDNWNLGGYFTVDRNGNRVNIDAWSPAAAGGGRGSETVLNLINSGAIDPRNVTVTQTHQQQLGNDGRPYWIPTARSTYQDGVALFHAQRGAQIPTDPDVTLRPGDNPDFARGYRDASFGNTVINVYAGVQTVLGIAGTVARPIANARINGRGNFDIVNPNTGQRLSVSSNPRTGGISGTLYGRDGRPLASQTTVGRDYNRTVTVRPNTVTTAPNQTNAATTGLPGALTVPNSGQPTVSERPLTVGDQQVTVREYRAQGQQPVYTATVGGQEYRLNANDWNSANQQIQTQISAQQPQISERPLTLENGSQVTLREQKTADGETSYSVHYRVGGQDRSYGLPGATDFANAADQVRAAYSGANGRQLPGLTPTISERPLTLENGSNVMIRETTASNGQQTYSVHYRIGGQDRSYILPGATGFSSAADQVRATYSGTNGRQLPGLTPTVSDRPLTLENGSRVTIRETTASNGQQTYAVHYSAGGQDHSVPLPGATGFANAADQVRARYKGTDGRQLPGLTPAQSPAQITDQPTATNRQRNITPRSNDRPQQLQPTPQNSQQPQIISTGSVGAMSANDNGSSVFTEAERNGATNLTLRYRTLEEARNFAETQPETQIFKFQEYDNDFYFRGGQEAQPATTQPLRPNAYNLAIPNSVWAGVNSPFGGGFVVVPRTVYAPQGQRPQTNAPETTTPQPTPLVGYLVTPSVATDIGPLRLSTSGAGTIGARGDTGGVTGSATLPIPGGRAGLWANILNNQTTVGNLIQGTQTGTRQTGTYSIGVGTLVSASGNGLVTSAVTLFNPALGQALSQSLPEGGNVVVGTTWNGVAQVENGRLKALTINNVPLPLEQMGLADFDVSKLGQLQNAIGDAAYNMRETTDPLFPSSSLTPPTSAEIPQLGIDRPADVRPVGSGPDITQFDNVFDYLNSLSNSVEASYPWNSPALRLSSQDKTALTSAFNDVNLGAGGGLNPTEWYNATYDAYLRDRYPGTIGEYIQDTGTVGAQASGSGGVDRNDIATGNLLRQSGLQSPEQVAGNIKKAEPAEVRSWVSSLSFQEVQQLPDVIKDAVVERLRTAPAPGSQTPETSQATQQTQPLLLPPGSSLDVAAALRGSRPPIISQNIPLSGPSSNINEQALRDRILVAGNDSSNGGIVATPNLLRQVYELAWPVQMATLGHHNWAPYGDHIPRSVLMPIAQKLQAAANKLGPDVIVAICNTLCTAFPEANRGINVDVLNLIANTAEEVARSGGNRPVILATPATTENGIYPTLISSYSEGRVDATGIGAPNWAPFVNRNEQQPGSPTLETVRQDVANIVSSIPDDATSVWLCCTHYPALKPMIEEALHAQRSAKGLPDIPVIDPMDSVQGTALVNSIRAHYPDRARPGSLGTLPRNIVVTDLPQADRPNTQSNPFEVQRSVEQLTGQNWPVFGVRQFPDSNFRIPQMALDGQLSPIDMIGARTDQRNIFEFFNPGGADRAATALRQADTIMIATGFSVAPDTPETDGPPGTAALAAGLMRSGKNVILVTDSTNKPVLEASLRALGVQNPQVVAFDAKGPDATQRAQELIRQYQPDIVGTIELPGRSADGSYNNMRGISIGEFNGHLDALSLAADGYGIKTFGVGDGGNEAGMGQLPGLTNIDTARVQQGQKPITSTVPSDYPVTAWNSNLGALSILAAYARDLGRPDLLPTTDVYQSAVQAAVDAGAVDGVSRLPEPTVDGYPEWVHTQSLDGLHRAIRVSP